MKIFLYARKSSESEERQIQSIDDQLKIMRKRAKDMWYKIIEEFTESRSAKQPWRYKFNEMVDRLEKREAEWVIAWKFDRISRNPIDTWIIQFMLQNGKLQKIITSDREYTPIDAGLLLSVESWMANQYIIDLRKNVERWMKSKIEKWWMPSNPPEWYKNNKEDNTIIPHEPQFTLIRKMFDLYLSWNYTVAQIRDIANNEWWFRTMKRWKRWWKPLSYSTMYKMFWNVFYIWKFMWKWEEHSGKHKPILSELEFNRIQKLLWTKGRQRPMKREYSFTGLIKCWECWCMITAEDKFKYIESTNKTHHYIYYHCTKRNKNHKCKQKVITVQKLETQIIDILKSVEILPEFRDWALDIIKRDYHKELEQRELIYGNLQKELKKQETKLNNLTDLLLEERIDTDDFDRRKKWIKQEIKDLEKQVWSISERRDEKLDITSDFFQFANSAVNSFNNWDIRKKRIIFNSLGQNFVLKDWVLALELYPWIKPLENHSMELTREYRRVETTKKSTTISDSNAFNVIFLKWQDWVTYRPTNLYRYFIYKLEEYREINEKLKQIENNY